MNQLTTSFTSDQLQQIEELSGCNYSPEKIALYLDVNKELFMKLWYDKENPVRYHYDRGLLVAEFAVISKQKQLAESGNITAAQIFLKEAAAQEINNIRNKVLFGDEY